MEERYFILDGWWCGIGQCEWVCWNCACFHGLGCFFQWFWNASRCMLVSLILCSSNFIVYILFYHRNYSININLLIIKVLILNLLSFPDLIIRDFDNIIEEFIRFDFFSPSVPITIVIDMSIGDYKF